MKKNSNYFDTFWIFNFVFNNRFKFYSEGICLFCP